MKTDTDQIAHAPRSEIAVPHSTRVKNVEGVVHVLGREEVHKDYGKKVSQKSDDSCVWKYKTKTKICGEE